MTVWFTSDPHWNHSFVAHIRGFGDGGPGDRKEHDETLLANFQKVVRKGDQVWWLGDLAMTKPDYALSMIDQIPGEHHLIWGNHDQGFPMLRDAHKHQRQYLEVFASVNAFARRRINNQEVLLSHFPYAEEGGDHTPEYRYTQYRLPNEGRWLIHGHTHNKDQRMHGRQIHVGLDAWGMFPVSLERLQKMIPTEEV